MSAAEKLMPPDVTSSDHQERALTALADLAVDLAVAPGDSTDGDEVATRAQAVDIAQRLERALELFGNLGQTEGDDDAAPQSSRAPRSARGTTTSLGDLCFVGSFELLRCLRAVREAQQLDALAMVIEAARRKLARAVRAVLSAARGIPAAEQGLQGLGRRLGDELQSALAVRQLYADFRRGLRRAANQDSEGVLTALRYAASSLAALAASPHYAVVRASDRALLRRQRERLLGWAHAGKSARLGLELLEDIMTSADLLRDINQRQELRAHDSALIRLLLEQPPDEHTEWLAQLDRLRGLDDRLDALIHEHRGETGAASRAVVSQRLALLTPGRAPSVA